MRWTVLAAVLATGCVQLADLQPANSCGNYVLEAPEDCDAGPDGADWCTSDCHLVCQPEGCVDHEKTPLPNYRCGVDGLCHAAGGGFPRETSQFPFTPIAVTTSDIDSDGIPDLVGLTLDTMVVRFGEPNGVLDRELVALIPSSSGQASFGDLDGDGNKDALVPTADGLAVMTSSSNIPLPFPFANFIEAHASCLQGTQPRDVQSLDDNHVIVIVEQGGQLVATVLELSTGSCAPALTPVCGLADPPLGAREVSATVYATSAVTSPNTSAVLAVSDTSELCVLTIVEGAAGTTITAGSPMPRVLFGDSQPVFAQIDGPAPACPDLFAGDNAGTWRYPATGGAGGCSISSSATALPPSLGGGPGIIPAGSARVVPQIIGAGPDVLALTNFRGIAGASTIYAYVAQTTLVTLYASATAFTAMASADLDGDGIWEIVATSRLAPDYHILYRTLAPDGFLLDRVPTEGTPTTLALRDYDGNGLPDIALVESVSGEMRVDVAYSTPDRPLPPTPMASFPSGLFAMLPVQVTDAIDPLEKAEDLAVLQAFPGATAGDLEPALTLLHGGAQRSMFAFYDPRNPLDPNKHAFAATITGYFYNEYDDPMKPQQDVIAFEDVADASGFSYGWELLNPQGGYLDPARMRKVVTGLDYSPGCTASGATVCGASATFATARIGKHDVVLAVDGKHHLSLLDPSADQPVFVESGALAAMAEPPSPPDIVFRPFTADLDGQGPPELVLPFRPLGYSTTDEGAIVVCHLDATTGMPTTCENLNGASGVLAGYHCTDAGAGRLTPRGREEAFGAVVAADLAVSCTDPRGDGAIAILGDDGRGSLTIQSSLAYSALYIGVGDFTGDGVDDLAVLAFGSMASSPTLHILPQCEARVCGSP